MQGYLFMFFSLFRQSEETKRDHVARFESEQITILKNCAAELASLRQSSHRLRRRFSIIVSVYLTLTLLQQLESLPNSLRVGALNPRLNH